MALDSINKGDDSGRIEPTDDKDFYRFVAQATGEVEIEVNPRGGLTTLVTLYDDQKDENGDGEADGVDSDASDSEDRRSYLRYDVVAGGVYYVGIESKDQNSTGQYELHIRPFDPDTVPGNSGTDGPSGPLPGWGGVRGVQINLDGNGDGSSSGSIDDPADVRWFQIDGASAGNMLVQVLPVNDDLKPFVTAFRADGGGIDTDTGEFDGEAKVGFQVGENERIIVAVRSHNSRYTGGFTVNISQPGTLPDDPEPDFGETPRNLDAQIDDHGNGAFGARIETPNDDDWYTFQLVGDGYVHVEVEAQDSALVPFLELNRDGTSGGFFETDDGRDGRANVAFLPSAETAQSDLYVNVSALDGTQGSYTLRVWRSANKDDDHPDSGGQYAAPHALTPDGMVIIRGRVEHPLDNDAFRVEPTTPGPVAIQVISLTEGFQPFLKESWEPANSNNSTQNTDGGSGRGGRTFHVIDSNVTHVNIDISAGGTQPYGDYVLYVWQLQNAADFDPETIGIEASPIMLDGSGNGSLPGEPNGSETSPALNFAGDKDTFQVYAASDRPITFTVSGQDTFLRVYDASGHAIATDHNTGPIGESQVTIEANRGDLYYLEISGFTGAETGDYTVQVSQPVDDHPDAAIFTPRESQTRDATLITLDAAGMGQTTGQIESELVGDRDWFQTTVADRGTMTVDIATTNDTLDTFVRVYDSRGNFVAIDDDGGDGRNSHVTFATFQDETYFIEVSGYGDNSVGDYAVTVNHTAPPVVELIGTFDTLGGLDTTKWSLTYSGQANLAVSGGTVRLEATGDGASIQNNSTTLASRAFVANDVSFDLAGEFGRDQNFGYAEVTDGTNYIRIQMNRLSDDGSNDVIVSANGYTELENNGPIAFTENTTYGFSIENVGGEVHVMMDGTLLARYAGDILTQSILQFVSRSAADSGRHANLTPADVSGSFAIADPLPVTIPASTTTTAGTYDDFEDGSLDSAKFKATTAGQSSIDESNGVLTLLAEGPGAPSDDNIATIETYGVVSGDVSFDVVANLGKDNNSAFAEISDGTDYIRLLLDSDGAGGVLMSVESNGYTELDNIGPQAVIEGMAYHITVQHAAEGIEVYRDDTRIALIAGTIRLNSVLRSGVASDASLAHQQVDLWDDFNDNSLDGAKWNENTSGTGDVREENGRMVFRGHSGTFAQVDTNGKSGGNGWDGVEFYIDRLSGGTNGEVRYQSHIARLQQANGEHITISIFLQSNEWHLSTSGKFGNLGITHGSEREGTFRIVEEGSDINIYKDGVLRHTIPNISFDETTYFYAHAQPSPNVGSDTNLFFLDNVKRITAPPVGGEDRFAELKLDNVSGTFRLSTDPVREPYDDFNDNDINYDKWSAIGDVAESDGKLKLGLFRNSQPVQAYVTTANVPGGTNLRGFMLNFTRSTTPKTINNWEMYTRMELTNGQDWLRIGGLHQQTFYMESGGAYGSHRVTVTVPSTEIPDGPFEIRESNGNIEFLHNGNVKMVIPNQTVRAASYFIFQAHGDPENVNPGGAPQNYEAQIDNIVFYVDPVAPRVAPSPSLKSESDTGISNVDHVTGTLSLDFEWPKATDATEYQWREGELLADGTVDWNPWSGPQDATTAHVDLPHASIHLLSIRPIDAYGIAGKPFSRGTIVDVVPPRVLDFDVVGGAEAILYVTFDEPVVGDNSDIVVRDSQDQIVTPLAIDGFGTPELKIVLPDPLAGEAYTVTLNGTNSLEDIAGNKLDGDGDGVGGGDFQASFQDAFPFVIQGDQFLRNGEPVFLNAIGYQPLEPEQSITDAISEERIADDLRRLADFGNGPDPSVLRVYAQPTASLPVRMPQSFYDGVRDLDFWIIRDIFFQDFVDIDAAKLAVDAVIDEVAAVGAFDRIFAWEIGNEFRADTAQQIADLQQFMSEIPDYIRQQVALKSGAVDASTWVTWAAWPPVDPLRTDGNPVVPATLDFHSFNVYSYDPERLRDHQAGPITGTPYAGYLKALKDSLDEQVGQKPLVISETGLPDSPSAVGANQMDLPPIGPNYRRGALTGDQVAEGLTDRYWETRLLDFISGFSVFEWNDEWWKVGQPDVQNDNPEEYFGIARFDTDGSGGYELRYKLQKQAVRDLFTVDFTDDFTVDVNATDSMLSPDEITTLSASVTGNASGPISFRWETSRGHVIGDSTTVQFHSGDVALGPAEITVVAIDSEGHAARASTVIDIQPPAVADVEILTLGTTRASGRVSNVDLNQFKLVAYVETNQLYVQPFADMTSIWIGPGGYWWTPITNDFDGTLHVWLVPNSFEPATGDTSPPPGTLATAMASVITDQENDLLLDSWENDHFGNLLQGRYADTDDDKANHLEEFLNGSDPMVADNDSDTDDLADNWERRYFGSIQLFAATDDPDSDGLDNDTEEELGVHPGRTAVDRERDGLPDSWETHVFGTLSFGPGDDPDNNGTTALDEYELGLAPVAFVPLDVNKNGAVDASTDGNQILTVLFGLPTDNLDRFRGDTLLTNEEIEHQIQTMAADLTLDVNEDGTVDASTDGNLILTVLFGLPTSNLDRFRGSTSLTNAEIEQNVQDLTNSAGSNAIAQDAPTNQELPISTEAALDLYDQVNASALAAVPPSEDVVTTKDELPVETFDSGVVLNADPVSPLVNFMAEQSTETLLRFARVAIADANESTDNDDLVLADVVTIDEVGSMALPLLHESIGAYIITVPRLYDVPNRNVEHLFPEVDFPWRRVPTDSDLTLPIIDPIRLGHAWPDTTPLRAPPVGYLAKTIDEFDLPDIFKETTLDEPPDKVADEIFAELGANGFRSSGNWRR